MRRGLDRRRAVETGEVTVPNRRTFLGVGIGCALPLVAGAGLVQAGTLLSPAKRTGGTDPVWEHITSEALRLGQEMQGPLGPRGEHVRRVASLVDLYAVHLRGCRLDLSVDDEARRLVRERGREAAAFAIVDAHREHARRFRRVPEQGVEATLDPTGVAAYLDQVQSHGVVRLLRSRRALLDRVAAGLDRRQAAAAGRVRSTSAAPQKPGDDFQGLPEPPGGLPGDACQILNDIVMLCGFGMALLGITGQLEAIAPLAVLQGIVELAIRTVCPQTLY